MVLVDVCHLEANRLRVRNEWQCGRVPTNINYIKHNALEPLCNAVLDLRGPINPMKQCIPRMVFCGFECSVTNWCILSLSSLSPLCLSVFVQIRPLSADDGIIRLFLRFSCTEPVL